MIFSVILIFFVLNKSFQYLDIFKLKLIYDCPGGVGNIKLLSAGDSYECQYLTEVPILFFHLKITRWRDSGGDRQYNIVYYIIVLLIQKLKFKT